MNYELLFEQIQPVKHYSKRRHRQTLIKKSATNFSLVGQQFNRSEHWYLALDNSLWQFQHELLTKFQHKTPRQGEQLSQPLTFLLFHRASPLKVVKRFSFRLPKLSLLAHRHHSPAPAAFSPPASSLHFQTCRGAARAHESSVCLHGRAAGTDGVIGSARTFQDCNPPLSSLHPPGGGVEGKAWEAHPSQKSESSPKPSGG